MTYVPPVPIYDPYEYDPYDLIPPPGDETSVVTPPQLEKVRDDLERQIKQIYNDINDLSYYDTYIINLVNENSPTYTLPPATPSNRLYIDNKAEPTTEGVVDPSQTTKGHQYYLHQSGDFIDITDPNGDGTESVHLIEPGVTKILLANHSTTTAAINASVTGDAEIHKFLNQKGEWLRGLTYKNNTKIQLANNDVTTAAISSGGNASTYLNQKGEWHRGLTYRAKSGGTGGNNDYVKLASDENTSFVINKTDGSTTSFLNARGTATVGLTYANATVGSGANPSQHPLVLRNNSNLAFRNFNDGAKTTTFLRADGTWSTPVGSHGHPYVRNGSAVAGGWDTTYGGLKMWRLDVLGSTDLAHARGNATFTSGDASCPGLYLEYNNGVRGVIYASATSNTWTASRAPDASLTSHAAKNVRIGLPYSTAKTKQAEPQTKAVSEIDLHKIKTVGHELDVLSLQEAGFDISVEEYDINFGDPKQENPPEYQDEVTYGVADVLAFLVHTVQEQHHQLTTLEAEVTKLRNS